VNWTMNSASIIGTNHIWDRSNRQDFVATSQKNGYLYGVVCDGCGSGSNSEVGACLIGNTLMARLALYGGIYFEDESMLKVLCQSIRMNLGFMLEAVMFHTLFVDKPEGEDPTTKVQFIENHLLSTFLFFIADRGSGKVIVGSCGDGIIIADDDVRTIDQSDAPHYLAYDLVPKERLVEGAHNLTGVTASLISPEVKKIVIATDGVQPLLNSAGWQQTLYGTTGRQLQRKFNVFQTKDKLFGDDASCVVLEQVEQS
jgi:hypothetical protein